MDNYILADDIDEESPIPFPSNFRTNSLEFELKKNTKFPNIISRIEKELQKENQPNLIFYGSGDCCVKCVSCVEMIKKKIKQNLEFDLYQWNELRFSKSSHTWAPTEDDRLDKLIVERNVPKLFILLSKDPFPEKLQSASQQSTAEKFPSFLNRTTKDEKPKELRKQPFPGSSNSEPNKWKRLKKNKSKKSESSETNKKEPTESTS